ncbi:CIA30 family protein [Hellea balneolensis]|uniref:CIA30 family protein n=1 Tax=Hellea balneolensis TaxID=287478 RepID=UPI0006865231|nr:CIA30 family protein [Hellea balneolensis]
MLKQTLYAVALLLSACTQAEAKNDILKECKMHVDFETSEQVKQWRAVNDGVMGGKSSGGPRFEEGQMVFEGVINTNGGGFSSVRRPVTQGVLAESDGLKLRIKSDGRGYKVTMRTNIAYRGRLVSFQAPIPETQAHEWEEVEVSFETLSASIFGRPVRGAEFDPSEVSELGLILADGRDGPFRLNVKWIKNCA